MAEGRTVTEIGLTMLVAGAGLAVALVIVSTASVVIEEYRLNRDPFGLVIFFWFAWMVAGIGIIAVGQL